MTIFALLMSVLFIVSLFYLIITLIINERLKQKNNKLSDDYILLAQNTGHFVQKQNYIRPDEIVFYEILYKLFSEQYYIFPQARLTDLINIELGFRDHDNLYNAIGLKSVDYLIVTKDKMKPILAIELNGDSHHSKIKQTKDKMKETILSFANIPLLTIQKEQKYNAENIKLKVLEKINNILTPKNITV
jgi:hypothetical protein